jgi:hypothetical protein
MGVLIKGVTSFMKPGAQEQIAVFNEGRRMLNQIITLDVNELTGRHF